MWNAEIVNHYPRTSLFSFIAGLSAIACLSAYFGEDSVPFRIISTAGVVLGVGMAAYTHRHEQLTPHSRAPFVKKLLGSLHLALACSFLLLAALLVKGGFLGHGGAGNVVVPFLGCYYFTGLGVMSYCQGVLDVAEPSVARRSAKWLRALVVAVCIAMLSWGVMSGMAEREDEMSQRDEAQALLQVGEMLMHAQPTNAPYSSPADAGSKR